jgi:hypothetical protein
MEQCERVREVMTRGACREAFPSARRLEFADDPPLQCALFVQRRLAFIHDPGYLGMLNNSFAQTGTSLPTICVITYCAHEGPQVNGKGR